MGAPILPNPIQPIFSLPAMVRNSFIFLSRGMGFSAHPCQGWET